MGVVRTPNLEYLYEFQIPNSKLRYRSLSPCGGEAVSRRFSGRDESSALRATRRSRARGSTADASPVAGRDSFANGLVAALSGGAWCDGTVIDVLVIIHWGVAGGAEVWSR